MKLQFKKQAYQTHAVEAVADCFAGQRRSAGIQYRVDPGMAKVGDTLRLDYEQNGFKNADVSIPNQQLLENIGYTDLMVDGAPSPHQSDTTLRWLTDRLRS